MSRRAVYLYLALAVTLIAVGLLGSYNARASDPRFSVGEQLNHLLSVCLVKQDAIEILTAHSKDGFDKAKEVWDAKEKCQMVPVRGPFVGKVVFSIKVKKDGVEHEAKIVEILDGESKVLAYFITTLPVENKRDRNA